MGGRESMRMGEREGGRREGRERMRTGLKEGTRMEEERE